MSVQRVLLVSGCSLCVVAAAFAGSNPVAVSPGSATGALIGHGCPTFSWSEVEGAESYELVVYRVGEEAEPVLQQALGSALSWTPSLDRCLVEGAQYAWSVRAVAAAREWGWSPPSLFSVAKGPSEAEFEEAVALVLEYLEGNGTLPDRPSGTESGMGAVPRPTIREPNAFAAEPETPTSVLPTLKPTLPDPPSVISLVTDGAIGVGTSTPLADLNVVGSEQLGGIMVAPNPVGAGGSSELLLAEYSDGSYGMKIKYDGSTNNLEFWGHEEMNDLGPWLTINRERGVLGQIYRYKTDIEGVTESTVFQDDDHLYFSVGANERWTFEALLWVSTTTAAGDVRFLWDGPSGSDVRANMVAYEGNGVATQTTLLGMRTVLSVDYAAAASIQPVYMKGVFSTADTGGTIRLEWAQIAASGTTRVYFPSQLEARKVRAWSP